MIEILAQIETPRFCAGIVLHDDYVVEAAPIVRHMKRWHRDRVRAHCRRRRWRITVVHKLERTA